MGPSGGLDENIPTASHLNTWSLADGTILGGYETFRRWNLAGRRGLLGLGLDTSFPLSCSSKR